MRNLNNKIIINDLRIVKEYQLIMNSKIIVYGCGNRGKKLIDFMNLLGCKIIGICDSDLNKRGKKISGIEVCHLSDLSSIVDDNTIVVVASVYYAEIIENVLEYVKPSSVFTQFSFLLSVHLNYKKMGFAFSEMINEYMGLWKKHELATAESILKLHSHKKYFEISNNAVLIYQPGKTGSTALYESLVDLGVRTCHCHFLFEYSSDENYLEWCQNVRNNYKGKIIIPIREPISRDISAYFQYLDARLAALLETFSFDDIYDGFIKIYYHSLKKETNYLDLYLGKWINYSKYGYQFDFFETELKKYFGVDVFEYPFDRERGWEVIHKNNLEIMIIQSERMKEYEALIGKFLNIENFLLKPANVGDSKEYAYLYQNFREQIKLPKEYIDFYYKDNVAFDHFYSKKDREAFYGKWIKNITN